MHECFRYCDNRDQLQTSLLQDDDNPPYRVLISLDKPVDVDGRKLERVLWKKLFSRRSKLHFHTHPRI